MGKNGGFLTPKAIANRIKAKGLQKLRWYCQMCQKQCRDENGFKCHTMSESHQRQMSIFSDSPHKFLDSFSEEFEDSFIRHLRHRHGTKRVHANMVYAELIRDRHHLHMNATKWTTLTEFVKYLGRTGKATVDETPKGWFIAYIDRDPETLARQKALERKKKGDIDEEERERLRIEKQLEEARRQREALGLTDEAGGDDGGDVDDSVDNNAGSEPNDGEEDGSDGRSVRKEGDGGGGGEGGGEVKLEGVKIAFSLGGPKKQGLAKKEERKILEEEEEAAKKEAEEVDHDDDEASAEEVQESRKRKTEHREPERERERDGERNREEKDERDSKRPRPSRWDKSTASGREERDDSREREKKREEKKGRRGDRPARPLTAVEEIMLQEEKRKQRDRERMEREQQQMKKMEEEKKEKERKNGGKGEEKARTDYWLAGGIVVKVKHKTVGGGKYYNQKGLIEKVEGRYVGQIKMLQSGDVLRLDQDFLETVLPAIEGKVLVVNGAHRGERATLKAIDVDNFSATIQLASSGELVKAVAYEDIAKIA